MGRALLRELRPSDRRNAAGGRVRELRKRAFGRSEVLRRLRDKSKIPVLLLTARGEDVDRIVGLAQRSLAETRRTVPGAEIVLLARPTPERDPAWLVMSCRICPMPSLSSSADCALTKRPRPLVAACQRSSTPELSGLYTFGIGCGHCSVPAESRFSVSD